MKEMKKQNFLNNKKADITITILVIGVFCVCALALVIFFLTSLQTTSDFVDTGLIEKISTRMEKGTSSPDGFEIRKDVEVPYLKESRFVREHWYSLTKAKEAFYVKYYSK